MHVRCTTTDLDMKRTADQASARLNVARAVLEPDRNVRRYDTCLRQPVDLCVEQQADRLEPMLGATQSTQSAVEAKRAPLRTPARLHDGALSHLNRDWVAPGLISPLPAPALGLGSPLPHLHRDWGCCCCNGRTLSEESFEEHAPERVADADHLSWNAQRRLVQKSALRLVGEVLALNRLNALLLLFRHGLWRRLHRRHGLLLLLLLLRLLLRHGLWRRLHRRHGLLLLLLLLLRHGLWRCLHRRHGLLLLHRDDRNLLELVTK